MPAIHSSVVVLKTKFALGLCPSVCLTYGHKESMHAIVDVWPNSQNLWSQKLFIFLTPHSLMNRVKSPLWLQTGLPLYYLLWSCSSTLVLLVLNTFQRKLCIAFQGAMSFSLEGKNMVCQGIWPSRLSEHLHTRGLPPTSFGRRCPNKKHHWWSSW